MIRSSSWGLKSGLSRHQQHQKSAFSAITCYSDISRAWSKQPWHALACGVSACKVCSALDFVAKVVGRQARRKNRIRIQAATNRSCAAACCGESILREKAREMLLQQYPLVSGHAVVKLP